MRNLYQILDGLNFALYICNAKKERDGLCHQRTKTQTGCRTQPEFAKKDTLRIVPQYTLAIKLDTVHVTYPSKDYFTSQVSLVKSSSSKLW